METKFTTSEYKMILWSFDYIRSNLDITTDQLPGVLVKFWSIPDFVSRLQYESGCAQVIIFMFILRMNGWPEEKPEDFFHTFRFNQLFYSFQVILATIDHCRNNHIDVPSFPIFDIHKYSLPRVDDVRQLLRQYEKITYSLRNEN